MEESLVQRPRFVKAIKDLGYSDFLALKHISYAFIHRAWLSEDKYISPCSAKHGNATYY